MAKKKPKIIKYPYEYDLGKRKVAKAYSRIKILAGVVNGILVPIAFFAGFFLLGYSFLLKGLVAGLSGLLLIPAFILMLISLLKIIQFPLGFYSGYSYEHRYGLSNQGKKSWFKDYFKGVLVEYVFTIPVLTIVYLLLPLDFWWVYAGMLYFFLGVFIDTIYPVLILPFFYKLRPFGNRRLKARLLGMAKEAGVRNVRDVLVANESEKSKKANAMFAGLGGTKKIVLFDTLLDNFTEDEVETVIGHELGHYVHKDIHKGILLNTFMAFFILFVIHFILSLPGLGIEGRADIAGLPLFMLSFSLLQFLAMPLTNSLSRMWEMSADRFGLEMSGKPKAQISTEKRLADMALSDTSPHPLVEWLLFSHPNAQKRIAMVREWERSR